ncbi:hypothetical protein YH65_08205 [Sulfurovum lithotrophicum]|uniref:DUF4189 domain-containing protein n=1 Tax=Sulfurovum lithotrophicum TaxID=206403 RepID=A0A7U4RR48_9BACT|nr:hypothetical protein [Sulfurovum lithotrophicum]AKF25371.1 hypothetical protein YH65_08205 [Sulfurovum lithotrophicum]
MKHIVVGTLLVLAMGAGAEAKCFTFSDKSGVGVCVAGDSSSARKEAKKICDNQEGNCGNIKSSSSKCHSNSGKCYDENGNASRSLSGY